MTNPTYTTITRIEINLLLEKKAPRCAFPVISAINSFMFDTHQSFPSVKTIIEWCGGHISKSGVEKALRWLEEAGIITRGKARTKSRFTNNIRKMVYGAQKVKECLQSISNPMLTECKHKENKQRKEPLYRENKQTTKSYSKWVKPEAYRKTHKKGFSKVKRMLGFDGGVNASEVEREKRADLVKRKFTSIVVNPRPITPEEAVMFQLKAKEDESWKWFVMGHHPQLYKSIFGVSPTFQEIEWAKSRI